MSDPTGLNGAIGVLIGTISDGLTSLGEQDLKILSLCDLMSDRIVAQDAEILALREGLAALSNRLEGLTRSVMSTDFPGHPRGRGDTITFAPDDSGKA